jgi:hypothetical protein
VGIEFHDVPEDGAAANFDHRLWAEFSFLAQTSTESAAQQDHFHGDSPGGYGCAFILFIRGECGKNAGEGESAGVFSVVRVRWRAA